MDVLICLIIGAPLGIWLYSISENAKRKEEEEKELKARELKRKQKEDERQARADAPLGPDECICDWVHRAGRNEIRSGHCGKHHTTWM